VTRSENLAFAANASVNSGPFKVGGDTGVFPGKLTSSNINFEYAKDDWNISVEASDQKSKINILSQPRIIAVANQKSQIIVNQKQPFANGSTTQNTGSTNPSQSTTTTTEEVGLDLTITPRINIDKDITLELELKITNISGNTSMPLGTGNDAQTQSVPIIGHRNITNTSVVENGKTLIIGGLLENIKTQTTIAPPVIGSIPYIGFMFTNTTDVTSQTELMIYITPTVIENTEQLRNITKSEMSKLENYDIKNKETIKQMLTGKKGEADDTFNVFDYFSNKKYRKEQHFIPQP